jgi:DNA-binding response OmpR family regulator
MLSGALTYLNKTRVDLIIVDLGLPDSHGTATVEKLAAVSDGTPFLVLSAEDNDSTMWEVICQGAEDHLVKADLKPESLIVAVVNAIARHLEQRVQVPEYPRLSFRLQ